MNIPVEKSRKYLRRYVLYSLLTAVVACVGVVYLFEAGMIGRCDGIFRVGVTFLLSFLLILSSIFGNIWMLFNRQGESYWQLSLLFVLQLPAAWYLGCVVISMWR